MFWDYFCCICMVIPKTISSTGTGRRTSVRAWRMGRLFPAGLLTIMEQAWLMESPQTTSWLGSLTHFPKLFQIIICNVVTFGTKEKKNMTTFSYSYNSNNKYLVIKDVCLITNDTRRYNLFILNPHKSPHVHAMFFKVSCCFRVWNVNIDCMCYYYWLYLLLLTDAISAAYVLYLSFDKPVIKIVCILYFFLIKDIISYSNSYVHLCV